MGQVWTVFLKEVRETVRDRRTLLIMIVVPVLLYPALMVVSEQLALFGMRQLEAEPSRVAIQSASTMQDELRSFLSTQEDLELVELDDRGPEAAVREAHVAAVALIAGGAERSDGGTAAEPRVESTEPEPEPLTRRVTIVFDAANDRSRRGREMLIGAFDRWEESLLRRRLEGEGLPTAFANPISLADSSVASPDEVGGYALGRFLPMLLIVITLLGTFYPAIDLAAGEKERGTLETLLTAPVPSREIVAGKFLTVAAVGVIAAALNLGSMLLTFQSGLFRFSAALDVDFSLPLGRVAIIFLTLIPLAVLFGSLFLGVAVRARSFKEAQNALTPLYMLALMPSLLPLFPGIEFTAPMSLIPIAGVALFFRELMGGSVPLVLGLSAIGSTVVYAWAALSFAAASFGSEDVLFGGESGDGARGPISGLFRRRREAPEESSDPLEALDGTRVMDDGAAWAVIRGTPELGQALLFVALVALLFFYLGAPLQMRWLERGLFATEWLLLFLPAVLFVALWRFDVTRTFSLRRPNGRQVGGALLMIVGSTPIAWMLAWLQSLWLPIPWELVEGLDDLVRADSVPRLAWLLVLIALTPAICEEAVFRGVLMAGSRRLTMTRAVVLNALVFGAFHVSFETAFRLLPTAWLGLVLAWAVWHTRSIWISGLMHFVNNGSIVVLAGIPWARELMGGPDFRPPVLLLIPAVASFALGARLILNAQPEPTGSERAHRTLAPLTTQKPP